MRQLSKSLPWAKLVPMLAMMVLPVACGGKQVPRDRLSDEAQPIPEPSFKLTNVPSMIKLAQPYRTEVDLAADVSVDRGNPVVEVRNLPEGATFDGRILSWAPPCDLSDEFFGGPKSSRYRRVGEHDVIVVLKSDDGSDHFVEKTLALIVYDYYQFPQVQTCEEVQQ